MLNFVSADGREREVEVLEKELINSGTTDARASVFRVRIRPVGTDTDGIFIVKDYHDDIAAEIALHNWKSLKEAGVRTWPTFRIEKGKSMVLVSDGESPNSLVFSPAHHSLSKKTLEEWGEIRIENFERTVDMAIEDVSKAAAAGIVLNPPEWLIRLVRGQNGEITMQYFVGDLEEAETDPPEYVDASSESLENLRWSLLNDIGTFPHMPLEERQRCSEIVRQKISEDDELL